MKGTFCTNTFPISPQTCRYASKKVVMENLMKKRRKKEKNLSRRIFYCIRQSVHMAELCSWLWILLYFYRLLITFANSLDPERARQNVGPDLDLFDDPLMVFLKDFFEKVNLKKIPRQQESMQNYPTCKELNKFDIKHQISIIVILGHESRNKRMKHSWKNSRLSWDSNSVCQDKNLMF